MSAENQLKLKQFIEDSVRFYNCKQEIIIKDGYLDIGIIDTTKDLFVNFIGATCFSIFGYLYIKNQNRYKFINNFMPTKKERENYDC